MTTYGIILAICLMVIIGTLFDSLSKKVKIPTVLMLLLTGIILRVIRDYFQLEIPTFSTLLPVLGLVGLALIVLEGGMDLSLTRDKKPLIAKALLSANFVLVASVALVGGLLYYLNPAPGLKWAILFAIPVCVVSSAITIPSIGNVKEPLKERLIYETTFADILGIMFFNLLEGEHLSIASFLGFGLGTVLTLLLSALISLAMLYFLPRITGHSRFFLLIAVLMLLYALGKVLHLPSLILMLIFGLLMNNLRLLKPFLPNALKTEMQKLETNDLPLFRVIVVESAFLIRTCFFFLFGYYMDPAMLADPFSWLWGAIICALLVVGRALPLLAMGEGKQLLPQIFIQPRGLVTVILFLSLPAVHPYPQISAGVIAAVILLSVMGMALSLKGGEG